MASPPWRWTAGFLMVLRGRCMVSSFSCLDGRGPPLPADVVNDDFCDCADGSDEPNTAACAGQNQTFYFCTNAGSTPQRVYASRVRDGICDCCDGSDEAPPSSPSLKPVVSCPNTCVEQGIKDKAAREERTRVVRAGLEAKVSIQAKAKTDREAWRVELTNIEKKLPVFEAKYERLKVAREAREAAEAAETAKNATNVTDETAASSTPEVAESSIEKRDGDASVSSTSASQGADKPEKKVVSEYAAWMDGVEDVMEEDEATAKTEKKVVSEYAAWMDGVEDVMEDGTAKTDTVEFTASVAKVDGKLGMAVKFEDRMAIISEVLEDQAVAVWNKQEGQHHRIDKGDCIIKANNVEVHTESDFKDNVGTDPVVLIIRDGCEEWLKTTTTTTTLWKDLTKKMDPEEEEVKGKVKQNTDRKEELDKKLKALDDTKLAYASLLGVTLETKVAEHDYKLSFFDQAKQGYTDLGKWSGWTGPNSGEFSGGSTCWQGPARKITVAFECGVKEEFLDVSEPSRCVYAAVVAHPGACEERQLEILANPPIREPHDEL